MRAKCHIVVLGNLDTHNWNKSDCFAPVMIQLEFRVMIALVVQMKVKPKQGDFTLEFCQSTLHLGEQYMYISPRKCPIILTKRTYY